MTFFGEDTLGDPFFEEPLCSQSSFEPSPFTAFLDIDFGAKSDHESSSTIWGPLSMKSDGEITDQPNFMVNSSQSCEVSHYQSGARRDSASSARACHSSAWFEFDAPAIQASHALRPLPATNLHSTLQTSVHSHCALTALGTPKVTSVSVAPRLQSAAQRTTPLSSQQNTQGHCHYPNSIVSDTSAPQSTHHAPLSPLSAPVSDTTLQSTHENIQARDALQNIHHLSHDSELVANIDQSSLSLSSWASPSPSSTSSPPSTSSPSPLPQPPSPLLSTSSLSSSSCSDNDHAQPSPRTAAKRSTPRKHSRPAELIIDSDDSDADNAPLISFVSRASRRAPGKSAHQSKRAPDDQTRHVTGCSSAYKTDGTSASSSTSPLSGVADRTRILRERSPFVPPAPGSMPKRPKKRNRKGRVIIYTPKHGGPARHYPADHAPTRRWDVLEITQFWMLFFPCHTTIGMSRNWRIIGHLLRRTKEQAKSHGQKMFLKWAKHPVLRQFIPPKANEHRSALPPPDVIPAARVFGRHGEDELSMESEPLIPADHAAMDEDTLEAMALWFANGVELPTIKRVNSAPRPTTAPRAKQPGSSRSSSHAASSNSTSSSSKSASSPSSCAATSKKRCTIKSGTAPPSPAPTPGPKKRKRTPSVSHSQAPKKGCTPKSGASTPKRRKVTRDISNSQSTKKRCTPKSSAAASSFTTTPSFTAASSVAARSSFAAAVEDISQSALTHDTGNSRTSSSRGRSSIVRRLQLGADVPEPTTCDEMKADDQHYASFAGKSSSAGDLRRSEIDRGKNHLLYLEESDLSSPTSPVSTTPISPHQHQFGGLGKGTYPLVSTPHGRGMAYLRCTKDPFSDVDSDTSTGSDSDGTDLL